MYEYLEGQVRTRGAARLVIDVGGVGYDLRTPLGHLLPAAGTRARVYTHLVVREDAHVLFGFGTVEDRDLFRLLLEVRGVGPNMALAVLSGLDRGELVRALLDKDAKPFTRAKGVGKKTAEQIVLDLADKAPRFAAGLEIAPGTLTPAPPPEAALPPILEDAASALVGIGFPEKEALRRVQAAAQQVDPGDLEALVRTALRG